MKIKRATINDLNESNDRKFISKEQRKKLLKFHKKKTHFLLVAKTKSLLCGILHARMFRKISHIEYIFVDKDFRGKGVSDSLVNELENLLKKEKITKLKTWTYATNKPATKFWKNQGFFIISKTKDMFGKPLYALEKEI